MVFQCGGVVFSAQVSTDFRRHVFWCDFVVCPSFTAMVSKCGGDAGFSSRSFYGFLKGAFYFFVRFRGLSVLHRHGVSM